MKRREFVKTVPLTALVPAGLAAAQPAQAQTETATGQASSGASGTGALPDYAGKILDSDLNGVGPDGKPTGQKATFSGGGPSAKTHDHQMKLTKEEQDILDGKEGKEKAKLMKILVAYGNAFGAEDCMRR